MRHWFNLLSFFFENIAVPTNSVQNHPAVPKFVDLLVWIWSNAGLCNCLEFSQHPLVFTSGYANTKKVFYCLINITNIAEEANFVLPFHF